MPELDVLRLVVGALLIGLTFYATICAGLYVAQRKFIFVTSTERPDPVRAGVPEVEVTALRTPDGLTLNAWYQAPEAGQPVALFLHGNTGHIGHRAGRMVRLAAHGWGALLVDYRGFGGNEGKPSEEGLAADARAAFAWLAARGVAPERIVIWGESLGTAIAARLATEVRAGALVLEAPFTSMADVAKRRYPFVPVNLLLKDRFDSLGRIGRIDVPLLVIHGRQDSVIPYAMAERLFAAAAAPQRRLASTRTGGHNDLVEHGVVEDAVAWIGARLPPPGG